jgi:hypothetical protein
MLPENTRFERQHLSYLSQTLGPYLGDRVQRRSPDRRRPSVAPYLDHFYILVGDACEGDSARANWFMTVEGTLDMTLGEEEVDKLCFDIIAHIPQEDVSTWFAGPEARESHGFKDLFRGLRSISISEPTLSGGDWSPLTIFLARRAAVGNRISSLRLHCYPRMEEDVVESIKREVEVFEWGSYEENDDGS